MSEPAAEPLRVVIVDDEAPARSRMRDLLSDCAAHLPLTIAGEAAGGRAALALLAEQPADVILMDIRMPEMDGIEVAQHLQKLEHPPAVVFTTAYDAYAIRAFEVHAVDYLLKPIRAARLRAALMRVRAAVRPNPETLRQLRPEPRAFLSAQERGKIHLIPIADVIYLKAELKYVTVRDSRRECHRRRLGRREARLRHPARRQGRHQPQALQLLGPDAQGRYARVRCLGQGSP